jgi:hypothetical protein
LRDFTEFVTESDLTGNLCDGTELTAWRSSSAVFVEISGTRGSITEVSEQLAWLGAALRSSPFDGIAYCRPRVAGGPPTTADPQKLKQTSGKDVITTISIVFSLDQDELDIDEQGMCWRNLFRSPVIVRGFPISRTNTHYEGLELPLDMMAGLIGAIRAHLFDNVVFIKGFSSMLVPSVQVDNLLLWHVFVDLEGNRISYLENNLPPVEGVGLANIQAFRHIVDWCSSAKSCAGML